MTRIDLRHGLDLDLGRSPPAGAAIESVVPGRAALVLADYLDMRPAVVVGVGERVVAGQTLLTDRRLPAVRFTAPAAGTVRSIERGPRRRIDRIVIELDGDGAERFPAHSAQDVTRIERAALRDTLLRSGAWTALRGRPFNRVADPAIEPRAIYVTAIDTNPLAPDPAAVLRDLQLEFAVGLSALERLCDGTTYVCTAPGQDIPLPAGERLEHVQFGGPHPAGLAGTHMHAVGPPMHAEADLWHIGYQDVAAIGHLLLEGRVSASRVVSIGGPAIARPRLVRTVPGAELAALLAGSDVPPGRIVSGSMLSGRAFAQFLGRYDNQVSVVPEAGGDEATHRSWLRGLIARFDRNRANASVTTSMHGSRAGMLPLETFESVWPFRAPPAPLLRALLTRDADVATSLGCIGLAEEDVALCGFICPAKRDYPAALRATLGEIERRG